MIIRGNVVSVKWLLEQM